MLKSPSTGPDNGGTDKYSWIVFNLLLCVLLLLVLPLDFNHLLNALKHVIFTITITIIYYWGKLE